MKNTHWENIKLAVQYLRQTDCLEVSVDPDGFCIIPVGKRRKKIKAVDLVYASWYNVDKFTTERIIHQNLDTSDFNPRNLKAISKEEYAELKVAISNLASDLKIVRHPEDQYKVLVEYRDGSRIKRKTFEDTEPAQQFKTKKQLEYLKILNKYCKLKET